MKKKVKIVIFISLSGIFLLIISLIKIVDVKQISSLHNDGKSVSYSPVDLFLTGIQSLLYFEEVDTIKKDFGVSTQKIFSGCQNIYFQKLVDNKINTCFPNYIFALQTDLPPPGTILG